MLGYERSELIGFAAVRLYADPAEREKFVEQLHEKGALSDWRVPLVRKDGSSLTCQVLAVARRDLGGRIVGYDKMLRDISAQVQEIERLHTHWEEAIALLSRVAEVRDPYTAGHQTRVAGLAVAIAARLGQSAEEIEQTRNAALLHDIGKVSVPSEILSKPGRLSKSETDLIRSHPSIGFGILEGTDLERMIGTIILQHHERLDGSGYPNGLTDADIVLEAKILAVADVVEAMMSHRPYRPALGLDTALAEIGAKSGIEYEPEVVDACRFLLIEGGFEFSPLNTSLNPFSERQAAANEHTGQPKNEEGGT